VRRADSTSCMSRARPDTRAPWLNWPFPEPDARRLERRRSSREVQGRWKTKRSCGALGVPAGGARSGAARQSE
jgi:hypothetical protein